MPSVSSRPSAPWIPGLLAFAAVSFWGVSFVATKIALAEMSPVSLITSRFALGVATLHVILRLRREPVSVPRDQWAGLARLGFFAIFVHQMIQAHALTRTTAVRTGWLIGVTPLWSALLAVVMLRERLGPRRILGLAIGFAGALLVVSRGKLSTEALSLPSTTGDLLILASTVNWAVCTVLARGTIGRLGSARATAASTLLGWLMLLPFFLHEQGWHSWSHLSPRAIAAVAFLGVGCSGLAYLFWYAALARWEASRVAAFLYIEPLVTCAAAVPILGETMGAATVIGGIIVLIGVALVQTPAARRR